MIQRKHWACLSAVLVACGGAVDLGTPSTPDAASGAQGATTTSGTSATGSGGSATSGSGSSSTGTSGTGDPNPATSGSGTAGSSSSTTSGAGGSTSQGACTRDGQVYAVGATVPAGDGCNSCTCFAEGQFRCTRCACTTNDAGAKIGCGSVGNQDASVPTADATVTSACSLRFDPGPCLAYEKVYAYVNGACVEQIYGGCQGNANRFSSIEECMAGCDGRPGAEACPKGRVEQTICLTFAGLAGCTRQGYVCAQTCDNVNTPCETSRFGCFNGFCQAAFGD